MGTTSAVNCGADWHTESGNARLHVDIEGEDCWVEMAWGISSADYAALTAEVEAGGLILIDAEEEPIEHIEGGIRQYCRFSEDLMRRLGWLT